MTDKTYVPGIDGYPSAEEAGRSSVNQENAFSRPSGGAGTVVPDGPGGEGKPHKKTESSKPVLGFLYSVSRSSFGEFWPLYLGPNIIGRDSSCDIVLNEGTVSAQHATLIIHQEDDGEVYAGIKDDGSTHGVKVNGKSAHFDVAACNNHDIIKIGKAYELLFLLIEAREFGLKPADNFIETQKNVSRQVDRRIISGPGQSDFSRRISNPASGDSDRTHAMDETPEGPGRGTIPR